MAPATPPAQPTVTYRRHSKRGFASMDPARLREVCSKGGKSVHAKGRAYRFNSAKARDANRIARARGLLHRFTSEEARLAGSKGGRTSAANRRAPGAPSAAISS